MTTQSQPTNTGGKTMAGGHTPGLIERLEVRMPARERAVLLALYDCYDGGEAWCLNFDGIASRTDVPRRYVRGSTRALAARGLAVHRNGLFNKDGGVAGSGYACTELGARVAATISRATGSPS